jgi:hypothetical protein
VATLDVWWDNSQLMSQVSETIDIFKAAHSDCQTLFIFDQSSAHLSLSPDTLKAFEMNKSDGGKQHNQHDTIIPQSNPVAKHCGRMQEVTTVDGSPKHLKTVLEEHSFDMTGLCAKCSSVCLFKSQN